MRKPPGYETSDNRAWRLVKSLYGLRQSGRNWNTILDKLIVSFGFKSFIKDPCLYSRKNDRGIITILFVYVDDVYIASNSDKVLKQLPQRFREHYNLKILGVPRQLLGGEIKWGANFETVHISIRKLIVQLKTQMGTSYV
jgi:hypothetical protein